MYNHDISGVFRHISDAREIDFDMAVTLLDLPPESSNVMRLRNAAHKASLEWTGGKGNVWFAIGLDSTPCPKNCAFCSLGEQWGITKHSWRLAEEDALQAIRLHDIPGVGFIVLRTTDKYPLDDLLKLARKVVPLKHAKLVANIGDLSGEMGKSLQEAGFQLIYHVLRLREGVDTSIAPETRLRTMRIAAEASLELAALVDPVGSEHTSEEIARSIFQHKEAGATISGAMARVAVPGTPKYSIPTISTSRLAQITAVARLVFGSQAQSICSHPADEALVFSGANTLVVERGSIPRDVRQASSDWRSFGLSDAFALLNRAGYRTGATD